MGKLIILCGISGSGKSTFASEKVQNNPEKYIIINRDKLREAHYGYLEETINEYYNRTDLQYLESQITAVQDSLINFWLRRGKDVVIDATNLKKEYIKNFDKFGFPIEILYFDITLKEALTRDMCRNRKVGEDVITKQYSQYINLRSFTQKVVKTENI